jgi:carbon monoxide dehydrogenase subunit G
MDVEKTLLLDAPMQRVWDLLLDPKVMGACVPGMQSIDVISDTEYHATIHVKLAFISAKFKMKTLITEQTPPSYLRSESTGEDASVASSLKSVTELFLTQNSADQTELRVKVKVDLLGRLGSFGMNAMKTKADRMWDEFGKNLAAQINPAATTEAPSTGQDSLAATKVSAGETAVARQQGSTAGTASVSPAYTGATASQLSWWQRIFAPVSHDVIRIDITRGDTRVSIQWPANSAKECAAWLQEYLKQL